MITKDPNWRFPVTYLRLILQQARAARLPAEPLLAGTGLVAEQVIASDKAVTLADTLLVLANAERLLGSGWHLQLASRLTAATHGPLGFAIVTAPDIRSSLQVALRYISTRAPFLSSAGTLEGNEFVCRFYETVDVGEQRPVLMEIVILSLQVLIERPLGRAISGAQLGLAYPEPVYSERLRQVLDPAVTFNAEQHTLRLPAAWLDEPCALHDEAMHRYLVQRCEEELLASVGALPTEVMVRQALLAHPDSMPGLADIAASQHVSPRTLIRRLKKCNTSYRAILEDVRQTLAHDQLINTTRSVANIAWRLGYQDPSNFGRAFRKWYGTSPQRYRERSPGTSAGNQGK